MPSRNVSIFPAILALLLLASCGPGNDATEVAAPRTGLVGEWLFSGDAADTSGQGRDGTVNGVTPAADRFGNADEAYHFDGAGAEVTFAAFADLPGTFTYSVWIKPEAPIGINAEATTGMEGMSNQRWVIGPAYGISAPNAGAGISAGTNGVSVYEHSSMYMPALLSWEAPSALSGWVHLAVVYSAGRPSLYVNGAWVRDGLQSTYSGVFGRIESVGSGSYGFFQGAIDDLRLYDRVLSTSEIRDLHEETER